MPTRHRRRGCGCRRTPPPGPASLRALYNTKLPVFQVNQLPTASTTKYVTAYAGVNDVINGEASGKLVLDAKQQLVKSGVLKSGEVAKVAAVKFYPAFAATSDRLKGFNEATKGNGVQIVVSADNAVDATTGYKATLPIIPIIKSKGVHILYAQNDAAASGAIRALASLVSRLARTCWSSAETVVTMSAT